jgi:hypothetical protein
MLNYILLSLKNDDLKAETEMAWMQPGITKRGKDHIELLFDWFGIRCMTTDIFCFYLQNRLIQTTRSMVQ